MCFFCFIHSEKCEKMNCKTKKNVDTSNVHHHLSRICITFYDRLQAKKLLKGQKKLTISK